MAATGFTGFWADLTAYGTPTTWVNWKDKSPVGRLGVAGDADLDRVTELAAFHGLSATTRKNITGAGWTVLLKAAKAPKVTAS